jgi:hypothetical protein
MGSVRFVLYRELDAARQPRSGLLLDTLSAPPGSRTISNVVVFACRSCPILTPGATYWLVAEPDATSRIVGNLNTINDVNNNSIVFNDFGGRTGPWTAGSPRFRQCASD